jgi:hypothetical protein
MSEFAIELLGAPSVDGIYSSVGASGALEQISFEIKYL